MSRKNRLTDDEVVIPARVLAELAHLTAGRVVALTVKDVARCLDVSREHVQRRLISTGDLRSVKFGRVRRVALHDLVDFMEARKAR